MPSGSTTPTVGQTRFLVRRTLRLFLRDRVTVFATVVFVVFIVAAVLAPLLAPFTERELAGLPLQAPSSAHWFGTDELGRDIFSRILYGARTSLTVGVLASVISLLIGMPWGLLSGIYGRWADAASMRLTDALLAFPGIILALAVVAVAGPSTVNLVIAIGVIQAPRFTRLIRGEVLSLRERDFVAAARSFGATRLFIVRRAILPNVIPIATVQFTLTFATAVLIEASLSYLGLGVQPPTAAWGGMLQTARSFMAQSPTYSIFTGGAIFLTVLSLSLIGDALRDAVDPRQLTAGARKLVRQSVRTLTSTPPEPKESP